MKKILCLCFILCLTLSGCQAARVPGLDWEAEKMVELQVSPSRQNRQEKG